MRSSKRDLEFLQKLVKIMLPYLYVYDSVENFPREFDLDFAESSDLDHVLDLILKTFYDFMEVRS